MSTKKTFSKRDQFSFLKILMRDPLKLEDELHGQAIDTVFTLSANEIEKFVDKNLDMIMNFISFTGDKFDTRDDGSYVWGRQADLGQYDTQSYGHRDEFVRAICRYYVGNAIKKYSNEWTEK